MSRWSGRFRARYAAIGAAAAVLLSACSEKLPQDSLDPHGPYARKVDNLFRPVLVVAAFFFFLVQGLVLYVAIRFRARGDDDTPKQVHGNTKLEVGWTIVPAAILAVIGIFTVGTLITLDRTPKGPDVLRVDVTGHQWWWEFSYPDLGVDTANELHIPTNTKVALRMTSVDVIHSFWPPKLAGKIDVVPGRFNHMAIEADEPGTFSGQCAEFCGLSHANMRLDVVAHDRTSFSDWVAANQAKPATPAGGDAAEGLALFKSKGCVGCHTVDGVSVGKFGPNLSHLQKRRVFAGATLDLTPQNLRRWLRNPTAVKPQVQNGKVLGMPNLGLSEDEITKLIAYLETLR